MQKQAYYNLEVISMTNINCSSNCVYQKDGKCCLENVSNQKFTPHGNCAYYLNSFKTVATK